MKRITHTLLTLALLAGCTTHNAERQAQARAEYEATHAQVADETMVEDCEFLGVVSAGDAAGIIAYGAWAGAAGGGGRTVENLTRKAKRKLGATHVVVTDQDRTSAHGRAYGCGEAAEEEEEEEDADPLVRLYCDGASSAEFRRACLSHLTAKDVCTRSTESRERAVEQYVARNGQDQCPPTNTEEVDS